MILNILNQIYKSDLTDINIYTNRYFLSKGMIVAQEKAVLFETTRGSWTLLKEWPEMTSWVIMMEPVAGSFFQFEVFL